MNSNSVLNRFETTTIYGIRIIDSVMNKEYKKEKDLLQSAKTIADSIIEEAREKSEHILNSAKNKGFEEGMAEILAYKAHLYQRYIDDLKTIESKTTDTIKKIIDSIFCASNKREFMVSQAVDILKYNLFDSKISTDVDITSSVDIKYLIEGILYEKYPSYADKIIFSEPVNEEEYNSIVIHFDDKSYIIDSEKFINDLKKYME